MAIGIGGASAAKLFAERTGFPEELLYYDETAECASALGSVPRAPAFCALSSDGLARGAPLPAAAADARRVAALQLLARLWARDGISAAEQRAEPVPAAPPHAPRRRVARHARQGSVTTSPCAHEARCRTARVKPAGAGARRAASVRPRTDAHPGAGNLWLLWGPQRRPALDPSPGPRAFRRPVILNPRETKRTRLTSSCLICTRAARSSRRPRRVRSRSSSRRCSTGSARGTSAPSSLPRCGCRT